MPGIVAERVAFSAVLFFAMVVVLSLSKWQSNSVLWIVFLLLPIYTVINVNRCQDWQSELTLLRNDLKKQPESLHLQYITGKACLNELMNSKGKHPEKNTLIDEAIDAYERVLAQNPNKEAESNNALGNIYYSFLGKPKEAYLYFQSAIEIEPNASYLINYVQLCFSLSKMKEAENALSLLLKMQPENERHHAQLCEVYMLTQQAEQLAQLSEVALKKGFVNRAQFLIYKAISFEMKGQISEAISNYELAISLQPNNNMLQNKLKQLMVSSSY
jgi:tetratricopeptide (TPR) repeat protein